MLSKDVLIQIAPRLYEIPTSYRDDMRVPARLYADEEIVEAALGDGSIEQLINTSTLPGVVKYTLAMPDIHQGYGFPIGGVAATALPDGVISPGGVGYDINCGVRLLTSTIEVGAARPHMVQLMDSLVESIPTGVGARGTFRLSKGELYLLLEQGSSWVVGMGYGRQEDLEHTEDEGRMEAANIEALSRRAIDRGHRQVGTLGAGNHFVQVDEIAQIYDEEAAEALNLVKGQVCVWIHAGSRGLGHQVCIDAIKMVQEAKYNIDTPDPELASIPFSSQEGQKYFQAMSCAANFAWANRQAITHLIRRSFEEVFSGHVRSYDLRVAYDVCHNIANIEEHEVAGEPTRMCVHRKGATRALGPGHRAIAETYRAFGQPVFIPGDMERGSYILLATEKATKEAFGSICHGAGRLISRSKARETVSGEDLHQHLENSGIIVRSGNLSGLAEEAPQAHKNVHHIVDVVEDAGLCRRVARTVPLGVIKG
ncbi:MAG: RtcB family protein [Chloroflexota bacterium]|nr:RtcB family protein [Chloroflexota bacterium]